MLFFVLVRAHKELRQTERNHSFSGLIIELFRLGGLVLHFRACDDTLENS